MLMMTVISFFFSGFVLVKVPFPVTQRFKQMLQSGGGSGDAGYVLRCLRCRGIFC